MSDMFAFHKMLINDSHRMRLYRMAIMQTVRNGDVVIDIGTGTGVLALFACQAGAKRVYAIERGDIIELAKELARANGFNNRIIFIKNDFSEVSIKEKIDVIVSELISNFGIGQDILRILTEHKNFILKNKTKIIPTILEMYLAPVEEKNFYNGISFWDNKKYIQKYNIDFSPLQKIAVNNIGQKAFLPQDFLAPSRRIYYIDFQRNIKKQGIIKNNVQFTVSRRGVLHGFCGFFRSCLAPGIWLSNKPPVISSAWTNVFFPLEEPVIVNIKDNINVELIAFESRGKAYYRWKTSVSSIKTKEQLVIKKEFDQCDFSGEPMSLESLVGLSCDYCPNLSKKGHEIKSFLNLCDGKTPLRDIANKVYEKHLRKIKNLTETDIEYLFNACYVYGLVEGITTGKYLNV